MTTHDLTKALAALAPEQHKYAIKGIQRGIEREALRIKPNGVISQQGHPKGVGCALTNGHITTDFSESLLEFITPVSESAEETLNQLQDLQKFTLSQMGDELLWPISMPCFIEHQDDIVLAQFGDSNIGRMKTLYREGLKNRYGSMMQAIAGVHFNISFPESFWLSLQTIKGDTGSLQEFISAGYLGLIRNFKRELWLISYLFGASPALCNSFLQGRSTDLPFKKLGKGTLYLEVGTALRLGNLGYTNSAQSSLKVLYNSLDEYVAGLKSAIHSPSDIYGQLADYKDAQPKQLNKNVLQIENEFYSPIRPKRNAKSGETPTDALLRGGIEYIEIRALDVNPFAATGIDIEQIHFLDVFLTYCLLKDSPTMDWDSQQRSTENLDTVVSQGRALEVMLNRSGNSCSLATWGAEIFAQLQQVAAYMDNAYGVSYYSETITRLSQWIADPELTYSGRYVSQLKGSGIDNGYFALSLAKSYQQQHQDTPYKVYSDSYLKQQADQSVIAERELKAADNQTFNAFLDDYFATK
ncbi:MAG: glutamate--cysteine ligase [Pseudoalteromonas rhizosphaerae]|uniref:Glutamate--cysteine ligase n=1 Tax=Pseudoalteromonas neustonica TaxID=1840331 RepID=A0ABY3FE57_9GAMM|nr:MULTISPECIES: glutamate--cysteine ligase [Pseudoalteromonas]MBB1295247.1 glutamate--cysteine ligase [Pseudoalteromonas sp. SR41-4]MBB1396762.1 glutamate--cysteine ligase [Pseudoalteromonas sp. SG44-8]MBB1505171.1 glutamate--cysteine ligase [Pseudoalteromonas sp. SG41-1]TVU83438.1 glutamate--cysteine ligase [Pseudoalteromonas neustonica]